VPLALKNKIGFTRKNRSNFLLPKTLLDLVFNPQKYANTLVDWYNFVWGLE